LKGVPKAFKNKPPGQRGKRLRQKDGAVGADPGTRPIYTGLAIRIPLSVDRRSWEPIGARGINK